MRTPCICFWLMGIFLLSACKKGEPPEATNPNEVKKIGIQKLAVLPADNINLADRNNWQLFVGSKKYNFLINDENGLTATPGEALFYFEYRGNVPDTQSRSLYVYFSSEEYCDQFGVRWSESGPHFNIPEIFDQSSVADLKKHDLLFGNYNGSMTTEISKLRLTHANALLDFKVTGKKKSDTIYIHDLKTAFLPVK